MDHRRRATLSGAATLLLSGCLAALRPGSVGVRVENRDDRPHAVDVEFLAAGELVAERRFEVSAGEERAASGVVDPGEYAVDVTLDGETHASVAFTMRGCTENTLFVAVTEEGALEAGVLDEC